MALIECTECQRQISDKARFCPGCGAAGLYPDVEHSMPVTVTWPKSRGLAIVLALFLGGLGIHKFYLGLIGWGVVYLVFCWTFIPMVLGVLDAICYGLMSDEEFSERYD